MTYRSRKKKRPIDDPDGAQEIDGVELLAYSRELPGSLVVRPQELPVRRSSM